MVTDSSLNNDDGDYNADDRTWRQHGDSSTSDLDDLLMTSSGCVLEFLRENFSNDFLDCHYCSNHVIQEFIF